DGDQVELVDDPRLRPCRPLVARADEGDVEAADLVRVLEAEDEIEEVEKVTARAHDDLVSDRLVDLARIVDLAGLLPARAAVRRAREPGRPSGAERVQ